MYWKEIQRRSFDQCESIWHSFVLLMVWTLCQLGDTGINPWVIWWDGTLTSVSDIGPTDILLSPISTLHKKDFPINDVTFPKSRVSVWKFTNIRDGIVNASMANLIREFDSGLYRHSSRPTHTRNHFWHICKWHNSAYAALANETDSGRILLQNDGHFMIKKDIMLPSE